jgi:hypothetical protein
VSLSGNLGFVSLDEVLRLLNRSNQRGMVDVQGEGVHGRIYFDRGTVTLATTYDDNELHEHINRSGMSDGVALASMLREMAVETVYRLGTHGRRFDVVEQQPDPIGSGTSFDLEDLLADARRRFDEWAEVGSVITDLDTLVRLRRDLGERDRVTIDRDSWRLLSEVGSGSSIRKIAKELGATDFWAAKVAVGMIEEDLLRLETAPVATPPTESEWTERVEAPMSTSEPVSGEYAADELMEPVFAEEEPTAPSFESGAEEQGETPVEEVGEPPAAVEVPHNESWWTEPETARKTDDEGEVEEDTEAFLEKVFSGLEKDENQEEGYGLLRRRRLGTLRDLSNDS